MIEKSDAARLEAAVERLSESAERLSSKINSGATTVTLQCGGIGVWAAVTASITMLAVNIILMMFISSIQTTNENHRLDTDRRIDDLNHYLNAIYHAAPHLKEEK